MNLIDKSTMQKAIVEYGNKGSVFCRLLAPKLKMIHREKWNPLTPSPSPREFGLRLTQMERVVVRIHGERGASFDSSFNGTPKATALVNHQRSRLRLAVKRTKLVAAALAIAFAFISSSAPAQELKFDSQPGPYYVGEPVVVQVMATDLKQDDDIVCKLAGNVPDGLTLEGPQIGRSSSSFMKIINGRITKRESIDYRFNFVITSNREDTFEVGPFEVVINGKSKTIDGAEFRFRKLSADPNMEIEFSIEKDTVYVGENVPVSIRWAYAGEMDEVQYAFSNLQIRSPLFDQFSFRDKPRRTRTTLTLATAKGGIEVDGVVTQEEKGGKALIVVTGERTLVADSVGTFDSVPITCRTKKVTHWRRDLFGSRVAGGSAPSLSAGKPLTFTVKPIPVSGQPVSFAGAVGKGFSIDVAANRSVVRVGDPISLTINIQGDGNLEAISLPELDSQMGLSSVDFQIPTEKLSGKIDGNTKQFSVNVRVKNQQLNQIPALAFSWFDPGSEQFVTADSKPIALQVMETKIVSSSDVVSNPKSNSVDAQNNDPSIEGQQNSMSFAGANLAIETDPARLLANAGERTAYTRYIPAAIYGTAILFAAITLLLSRRSDESIEQSKMKNRRHQIRRSIQNAGSRIGKEAFSMIADALRDFIREYEPTNRKRIEQLIAECDTAIYARSDSSDNTNVKRIVKSSLAAIDNKAE